MAHDTHVDYNTEERFTLPSKARNIMLGLAGLGLLFVIVGFIFPGTHDGDKISARFWTNFMLNAYLFTAISVVAAAWIAIQYIANAGWSTAFQRIPEAMTRFLPIGAVLMGVVLLAGFIDHQGINILYEWTHTEEVANDPVLSGKAPYLNVPFFAIRFVVIMLLWVFFSRKLVSISRREDDERTITPYNRNWRTSATWMPIFAITFCMISWDWLMSLEPHWYSTMFGVNVFAGVMVTTLVFTTMILVLLQKAGYMPWVNHSHYQDLGKFIFGFSIFWMYTWTSQFLLIWYANLPEETPYYFKRLTTGWNLLFFTNIIINFAFPFLALMMRNSKRSLDYLFFVCIILLIGRWIDWYLLSMPGPVGNAAGLGFWEIGFFLLFVGLFSFVTFSAITKAALAPKHHPFLEESLHHSI